MKLYAIVTYVEGTSQCAADGSVYTTAVRFNERDARRFFRAETDRLQEMAEEDPDEHCSDGGLPAVELVRIKLLDLPKRELVKALIEAGEWAHTQVAEHRVPLESWEYIDNSKLGECV